MSTPSVEGSLLVDTLFPLGVDPPYFNLPSICAPSGWFRRRLSLDEMSRLCDYPPILFRKLISKQRLHFLT